MKKKKPKLLPTHLKYSKIRFGNDGYIDIEITKWEYWHKKGADGIDLQRVAFIAADAKAAAAVAAAAARGECPLDAPRAVRLLDFEQVDYNRREGFNATFFNGRLLELIPKYKGTRERDTERE